MKTLTIRQPWASLIAAGVKTIETRSWSTRYRGPLAIHAGAHHPVPGEELCGDSGWYWEWDVDHGIVINHRGPWCEHPAPLGAVVATCTLADVVPIGDGSGLAVGVPACVTECEHEGDLPHQQGGLWLLGARQTTDGHYDGWPTRIEDQRPFGDFTPGRYAWLLTDITPCDPVPAKGRQGLWDWEAPT